MDITRTHSYFLDSVYHTEEEVAEESTSAEEMKKESFLTLLNADLTESVWEFRAGENEGYPVIIGLK